MPSHTVSFGLGLRTLEHEVRTGDHLDVVEYGRILEVDAADLAATDDADPDRRVIFDNRASLFSFRFQASGFR